MTTSTPPGPRWLYLHGFASGPGSHKAVVLADHYQRQGISLERLDLRVPSLEHLRMDAMLSVVHGAMGNARDRAVVFGSSLGGLTACRVAEEDARVSALVLLAPAFCFLDRWRQRLGEEGWRRWETTDALAIHDYAAQRETTIDVGFARSVAAIDAERGPWPDVRVPTLIVHGRQDDVVDIAVSREFAHGRRHVRLIEVDDGHELAGSLPLIATAADEFLHGSARSKLSSTRGLPPPEAARRPNRAVLAHDRAAIPLRQDRSSRYIAPRVAFLVVHVVLTSASAATSLPRELDVPHGRGVLSVLSVTFWAACASKKRCSLHRVLSRLADRTAATPAPARRNVRSPLPLRRSTESHPFGPRSRHPWRRDSHRPHPRIARPAAPSANPANIRASPPDASPALAMRSRCATGANRRNNGHHP